MAWKPRVWILVGLMLLSPLAFAQSMGEPPADCDDEYEAALQEAADRRDESYTDAEEEWSRTYNDPDVDEDDRAEADDEYDETVADAEERYEDDRAEAEDDHEDCLAGDLPDEAEGRGEHEGDQDEWDESDDDLDDADDDDDREEDNHEWEDALPAGISGRHVNTQIAPFGLADYTVDGRVIFAEVTGPESWEEYEAHGASHELEADDQEARIVDSAAGNLRFESDATRAVPGPGLAFADTGSRSGHGNTRFVLTGEGFEAFVNGDDLLLHNGTLYGEEIRLVIPQGRAHDIDDAIVTGQIVAEVTINGDADATVLGPVNLTTQRAAGAVVVTIEGHGEGRTLLFDLEHKALGPIEDMEVLFDGVPIGPADDLADVLNVTDGGAEYLILVGKNSTQVLVQVPHFSVHEIRLQGSALEFIHNPPVVALALGAATAAVFVAGTRLMRRS